MKLSFLSFGDKPDEKWHLCRQIGIRHVWKWLYLQYLGFSGLDKYGYTKEAERIAGKYAKMVAGNFLRTANLWGKYNVTDGSLNVTNEYGLPTRMGWTAGFFSYCYDFPEGLKQTAEKGAHFKKIMAN